MLLLQTTTLQIVQYLARCIFINIIGRKAGGLKYMNLKNFSWILLFVSISSSALGNEIYIEQVGDNLDLDITQDGQNNQFGDSTTAIDLTGDDITFAITQTGDDNDIAAVINGNTYTGTWTFTGNTNTVDLVCDSNGTNCETVKLDITTTGDTNIFDFEIGVSADGADADISFEIDGDGNVLTAKVDGVSATIDITSDNSASNASGTINNVSTGHTTGQGGNMIDLDIDGDGDSQGHTVILDITGGANHFTVTQSGTNDNTVNGTFSGDGMEVNITQSD